MNRYAYLRLWPRWALVLVSGFLTPFVGASAASARFQHVPRYEPRIIGGTPESVGWAFMAYITYQVPGSSHYRVCTGTMISTNVVLTAGHCLVDAATGQVDNPAYYSVTAGAPDIKSSSALYDTVSRVMPNPSYDRSTAQWDAGLLVLTDPLPQLPALRLASGNDSATLVPGTGALVAGWGDTYAGESNAETVLESAPTVVQSRDYCSAHSSSNFPFDPTMELCAVNPPSYDTAICNGDSGGPLIALDSARKAVEIGIVSSGPVGCPTTEPGQYTRADAISTWATSVAHAAAPPAPPSTTTTPPRPAPSPPTLPRMSLSDAQTYVVRALRPALGQAFSHRHSYRSRCSRQSQVQLACSVSFWSGPNDYHGTVRVFYELDNGTVYWNDHYSISWVNERCYFHTKHPSRCRVSRRQGT